MNKILEALHKCETQKSCENVRYTLVDDQLRDYIEQDLEKLERLEKVIKILKREFQFGIQDKFLWIYDDYCGALETFSLTEEEIKLLKEVFYD